MREFGIHSFKLWSNNFFLLYCLEKLSLGRHVFTAVFQKSERQIALAKLWIFLKKKTSILLSRSCWYNMTRFDERITYVYSYINVHLHWRVMYIQMCNSAYNCTGFYFHIKHTHLIKWINIEKKINRNVYNLDLQNTKNIEQ